MIDTTRVLRPLDDAEGAIKKLDDYESAAELSSAVQAVYQAVDRSLRSLLRADPGASEEERLAAFSPNDLPSDRLIPALRRRDSITLHLAGKVHELEQASRRAAEGAARAADAELASQVVTQLRSEVRMAGERTAAQPARVAVAASAPVPKAEPRIEKARSRPPVLAAGAGLLVVFALIFVWFTMRDSAYDQGLVAFQAERWPEAEQHFLKAAEDKDDVRAQLALARVYRATGKYDRAADVLREAARNHPNDPSIQRELGKLFLDLKQPAQAVKYLKQALEGDPAGQATWIWLIRALRAAGDPSAEQMLEQAPDEVRATLARPG